MYARAIELISAGMPRNAIARELQIAPSSVSKIATEEGLSFDPANQTASATATRQHDPKVRRLELIDELMAKAADHLVAIDQPFLASADLCSKDSPRTNLMLCYRSWRAFQAAVSAIICSYRSSDMGPRGITPSDRTRPVPSRT